MSNAISRQLMLNVAADYDQLAEYAEEHPTPRLP
jgi:hypothetical protein